MLIYFCSALTVFFLQAKKKKKKVKEEKHARFLKNLEKLYWIASFYYLHILFFIIFIFYSLGKKNSNIYILSSRFWMFI